MSLKALGWDDGWAAAAAAHPDLTPARVSIEHRGAYEVLGDSGGFIAEIPGKLYRAAKDKRALPAVGDWILVSGADAALASGSPALVRELLPRRGLLVRQAAGEKTAPQPLAANVDVGFVVTSANKDLSPRRLERYLAFVTAGGARPVVVLNKIDLVADAAPLVAAIEAAAPGVAIVTTSAARGEAASLAAHLARGVTGVLCGSSGVGKSTLLNALAALAGPDAIATRDVKAATDRGRHTTTRRELFVLPSGGILVDTPGMRELTLWDDADEAAAFEEIAGLGATCRFADCTHANEPGCAVRAALDAGRLEPERYAAYLKLASESAAEGKRRNDASRLETRRKSKVATRGLRERLKDKNRD